MAQNSPPRPVSNDWQSWAFNLVQYLEQAQGADRTVILPYKTGSESAAIDGIVMFDPALGEPVYSSGGAWHQFGGA